MSCQYNSKKIIPAPFISISKDYQLTEDGQSVGTIFNIQVKGKICADMGSPTSSGTYWDTSGYPPNETLLLSNVNSRMGSILRKQEAIRKLFATEGQSFEIQPWDGSAPIKCNPRVKKIDFAEAQEGKNWVNTCDYTIALEADILYSANNGQPYGEDTYGLNPQGVGVYTSLGIDPTSPSGVKYTISKATDEWNLEPGDEIGRVWKLSHVVSAIGKRFYDNTGFLTQEAWMSAHNFVVEHLGLGTELVAIPIYVAARPELSGMLPYNYLRTEHTNELGGSYSVTENWVCYDIGFGHAIEEFNVSITTAENSISKVKVDGTLKGLEVRDANNVIELSRYAAAQIQWNVVSLLLYARAQTFSGLVLHPVPLGKSFGVNEINGVITYGYEYDNRASNVVTGAVTENITVTDEGASDVFASIVVLGRRLGPVLQAIGTITSKKRSIQIEATLPASSQSFVSLPPNTNSFVLSLLPGGTQVFLDKDVSSFTAKTGKYSRSVTWTWE